MAYLPLIFLGQWRSKWKRKYAKNVVSKKILKNLEKVIVHYEKKYYYRNKCKECERKENNEYNRRKYNNGGKELYKKYHDEHREYYREYNKQYYKKNKELFNAKDNLKKSCKLNFNKKEA